MSTQRLAHGIASLGRHGDTTMIHVAPKEIAGLETLLGRRMTINPHTGMREAFGWQDILPIAAAVVGTVASGGNPAVGALAAGGTKAAVSGAQGNSLGTALTQGLTTGITSYATGSLLQGVGTAADTAQQAGTEAATQTATQTAGQAGTEAATQAATEAATQAGTEAATQAATEAAAQGVTTAAPAQAAVEAAAAPVTAPAMTGIQFGDTPPLDAALPTPPPAPGVAPPPLTAAQLKAQPGEWATDAFNSQSATDQLSDLGRGFSDPKMLGTYAMDHPGQVLGTAAGLYDMAGGFDTGSNRPPGTASAPGNFTPHARYTRTPNMPGPDYRPGIDAEAKYFAGGGLIGDLDEESRRLAMSGLSGAPQALQPAAPGRGLVMPPANYRPGLDPVWNYFPDGQQSSMAAASPFFTSSPLSPFYSTSMEGGAGGGPGGGGGDAGGTGGAGAGPGSGDPGAPGDGGPGGPSGSSGSAGAGGDAMRKGGQVQARGLAGLPTRDMPSHGDTMGLVGEAQAALSGRHPQPQAALSRFASRFGPHALHGLQSEMQRHAAGGAVRGPGGGLDDAVPATINGRQPARLSDGEFVVPADVVSGLGDGSSEQGIRRLRGMMDQIRQQRTGRKAQPRAVSPSVMPG